MRFKPLDKLVRRMAEYYWYYGASDSWRAIFSLLERNDGASLLDLGCGDGSSTMLVAERIGTSKVYGIDLDEENTMRARERESLPIDRTSMRSFPSKTKVLMSYLQIKS